MSFLNSRTNAGPWLERRKQPQENLRLRSLAHAVIEAAQKLDVRMLGPAEPNGNLAFESRTLLAMLAFCYVRQVYGSAEVAARLRKDPNLHRRYGDDCPCRGASALSQREPRVAAILPQGGAAMFGGTESH